MKQFKFFLCAIIVLGGQTALAQLEPQGLDDFPPVRPFETFFSDDDSYRSISEILRSYGYAQAQEGETHQVFTLRESGKNFKVKFLTPASLTQVIRGSHMGRVQVEVEIDGGPSRTHFLSEFIDFTDTRDVTKILRILQTEGGFQSSTVEHPMDLPTVRETLKWRSSVESLFQEKHFSSEGRTYTWNYEGTPRLLSSKPKGVYQIQIRALDYLSEKSVLCVITLSSEKKSVSAILRVFSEDSLSVLQSLVEDLMSKDKSLAFEMMNDFCRGNYYERAVYSFRIARSSRLLGALRDVMHNVRSESGRTRISNLDKANQEILADFFSRSFIERMSEAPDIVRALREMRSSLEGVVEVDARHLENNENLKTALALFMVETEGEILGERNWASIRDIFLREVFREAKKPK
ncbi:MAG: hypothetical protein A2Z91_01585 [Deltaproteobacteria bacterium GWA2_38_16]|nr:MAG: hypothetical protein A2Z91_01585 [Deltaproteobacteria bacterium GWA2_38_16]OGQ03299.1 MAG: hypothetical protein A3D19_00100 [Deltaproteobacteria bacterium RIFCSPHIGHO2_02_FULL_38_15]OGQ34624.1 MAG: hypothetical protein A3A72_08850 [Deltaproteobacteria bacterium RIFCSPLOWO2_01_FULL_38_9]HBQ22033.1 hypothetical protein [Deltaproteobacteria bacterium]